jgi:hypothetical protein
MDSPSRFRSASRACGFGIRDRDLVLGIEAPAFDQRALSFAEVDL